MNITTTNQDTVPNTNPVEAIICVDDGYRIAGISLIVAFVFLLCSTSYIFGKR